MPYPPDYGGRFDIFYKLPALQAAGVLIHLHCFGDGGAGQAALESYCTEVLYYKRNTGHAGISVQTPYIVASRKNEKLATTLLADRFPILMEGVHCTGLVLDKRFHDRKRIVRLHNVEYRYYQQLCAYSKSLLKKIYYYREAALLKKYEQGLPKRVDTLFAITENDAAFYHDHFGCSNVHYLPAFIPPWEVQWRPGMGSFCLYHGKLSVDENEHAVIWLLRNIFSRVDVPFVIAGMNPSPRLRLAARKNGNVCLVANPSARDMEDLIAKAQVHVLPSFNVTGVKIKVLNALYNGRHCLVNTAAIRGTGLEGLCHEADSVEAFRERMVQLYHQPYTMAEMEARKVRLYPLFDNRSNAAKLVQQIFG